MNFRKRKIYAFFLLIETKCVQPFQIHLEIRRYNFYPIMQQLVNNCCKFVPRDSSNDFLFLFFRIYWETNVSLNYSFMHYLLRKHILININNIMYLIFTLRNYRHSNNIISSKNNSRFY